MTSATQSGVTTNLTYDAENRLLSVAKNGTTTKFLYDGTDSLVDYDGSGNVLRVYVHGPGDDEPLLSYDVTNGWAKSYLHADDNGSIDLITHDGGGQAQINTYDAYGLPGSGNTGRFQYTGQAWLPEIGMYYYKARLYNPVIGRFMQTDPIGYGDGMNWYNYVHGDPVNMKDPWGLDTYYTGSGSDFSCTTYTTHYYYQYSDGQTTNAGPDYPDVDNTYCDSTHSGYDPNLARQSGFIMDNSGGRFGFTTTTKPSDANKKCLAGDNKVGTDEVPDAGGGTSGIPANKSGFGFHGGTVAGAYLLGGTYSRGSFVYTGEDGGRYSGHYTTSGWGVGLIVGADYSGGSTWSTSSFFGKSLGVSSSLGPVSGAISINRGGPTTSIGLGLGGGGIFSDTNTSLDGPLKFLGCKH